MEGGVSWVCVCVCLFTVESGSLEINCNISNIVVSPTGLLSVWPWEWQVQATNFCFPETHSESKGAILKMSRTMYSPSHHHNGTCNMYAGLGGRVCVCRVGGVCVCGEGGGVCVCVHCGIRLFANHVSSF